MNGRRLVAVELLLSYPDSTVAEMLGVRLQTLNRWMGEDEFATALRAREREQVRGLARIARQAAIRAAASLCQTVADQAKPDVKVLLDILKASGAFEAEQADPADAVREIIRLAEQAAEATDEPR